MSSIEDSVGLPDDYYMVDGFALQGQEVVILRKQSEWGTDFNVGLWQSVIDKSIASVGVVGPKQNLVGVGFLAGNPRHAVLCDLDVHPNHRHKGIGQAIVRRRVQIADQLEIPYLYTELAPTNSLRSLYEELGFQAAGNAYTRAARRHPSELE
jgi:GNAT superfamily N-acetyltransferase